MYVCICMHMYVHVHYHDRRLLYEHSKLAMHKMMKVKCGKDWLLSAWVIPTQRKTVSEASKTERDKLSSWEDFDINPLQTITIHALNHTCTPGQEHAYIPEGRARTCTLRCHHDSMQHVLNVQEQFQYPRPRLTCQKVLTVVTDKSSSTGPPGVLQPTYQSLNAYCSALCCKCKVSNPDVCFIKKYCSACLLYDEAWLIVPFCNNSHSAFTLSGSWCARQDSSAVSPEHSVVSIPVRSA